MVRLQRNFQFKTPIYHGIIAVYYTYMDIKISSTIFNIFVGYKDNKKADDKVRNFKDKANETSASFL